VSAIAGTVGALPAQARRGGGVWSVYRVEMRKLSSQLLVRVALAICVLGPVVFIAIIKTQPTLPADTLFGRWLHTSGFALPFVMLGFASEAGFLVLVSVVAGDMFASEDRYGTWQTVLTRGCRRQDVFVGKTLVAATYSLLVVLLLAVSSLVAGLLFVGSQPVIGLAGEMMQPDRAFWMTLLSWSTAILPVLAFTCLGLLFSIATRSGIIGMLAPVVIGGMMELFSILGFRTLMLTTAFDAWHALLIRSADPGPFVQGSIVSIAYIAFCLMFGWHLVRRRDFAGSVPAARRGDRSARIRVGVIAIAAVLVLGAASYRPSPIDSSSLQYTVTSTFENLVRVKQQLVDGPVVIKGKTFAPGAPIHLRRSCVRGGQEGPSRGPGNDWVCTLESGPLGNPYHIEIDVDAKANGCFTASMDSLLVGPLTIYNYLGHTAVNPLYEFDGCVDTP